MTLYSDVDSGTPSHFVQATNLWYDVRDPYIARFVSGGVVKTFRCAATHRTMEIIFELLAQLVLEIVVQGIFELGGRGIVSIFRREGSTVNPWLAICGYIAMGAIAGGISVWLIPMHLLKLPVLQILNLAITPIVLGFIFEFIGRWKTNRDKPRYAVDRFSYGFTFALTMGLIRYFFTA